MIKYVNTANWLKTEQVRVGKLYSNIVTSGDVPGTMSNEMCSARDANRPDNAVYS